MKVIITFRAEKSLIKISDYITKRGSPDNAVHFLVEIKKYILKIGAYPDKFPLCRQKAFRKRNFHCVPFKRNYIIIYRILNNEVIIQNVVHAKRLR